MTIASQRSTLLEGATIAENLKSCVRALSGQWGPPVLSACTIGEFERTSHMPGRMTITRWPPAGIISVSNILVIN